MGDLSDAKSFMYKLIVHSLEKGKQPKNDNDEINLLRPEIAKLFPNVKNVNIDAGTKDKQYPFSLIALLGLIQMTNWHQLTITATGEKKKNIKDWISVFWISNRSMIEKEYKAAGY